MTDKLFGPLFNYGSLYSRHNHFAKSNNFDTYEETKAYINGQLSNEERMLGILDYGIKNTNK